MPSPLISPFFVTFTLKVLVTVCLLFFAVTLIVVSPKSFIVSVKTCLSKTACTDCLSDAASSTVSAPIAANWSLKFIVNVFPFIAVFDFIHSRFSSKITLSVPFPSAIVIEGPANGAENNNAALKMDTIPFLLKGIKGYFFFFTYFPPVVYELPIFIVHSPKRRAQQQA